MELLRQGDTAGLERMVTANPSAVRFLQGRLWDVDPERARHAAEALGVAAAAHPELGREVLRRALWALNVSPEIKLQSMGTKLFIETIRHWCQH